MPTSSDIADRILAAILAQRLAPGERLGEQPLSQLFDCSRTLVREALMQLAARGIVKVSARRGWFVVQPSEQEAREAFEARQVIETGLIRTAPPMDALQIGRLQAHIQEEQDSLEGPDVGRRSYLLGDFHVRLAECLGNRLLAETLRDYTARTTLIAMLYQSTHDAAQSCAEHVQIVEALARGDTARAETLMADHLGHVQRALRLTTTPEEDPLSRLRQALAPLGNDPLIAPRTSRRGTPAAPSPETDTPSVDSAPYLGDLL